MLSGGDASSDGLEWNENLPYNDPGNTWAVMARQHDWVKFTLDLPMASDPGSTMNYNSGATLILGHVFRLATGTDLEQYAAQHLLKPLGIEEYFWKRTPYGLADTQEGLYVSSRDIAKIAYLYLRGGEWEGQQLVPADYVKLSVAPFLPVEGYPGGAYGYLWWLHRYPHQGTEGVAFVGSGFGGQIPIVVPEHDLVLVFTGWQIVGEERTVNTVEAITRILEAVIDEP